MARRNKMTYEKKRREMEKKKTRAEKLERRQDRSKADEKPELPDPFEAFKEYEEANGTGIFRPEEDEDGAEKTD